jgi:putative oxidoreductase
MRDVFELIYDVFADLLANLQSFFLFLARLVLAYGFFEPAMNKWNNISNVASWFESMGIPMPLLNAYLTATIESLGVVLLLVGFMTRLISIPLFVIMIVAIVTVHLGNGFSAGDNGFEIPLYYALFLGLFASFGAGKFSLDYKLFGK